MAVILSRKAYAATVDSGTYGKNITWTLDSNGTMTTSGTGERGDLGEEERDHWWNIKNSIKTVVIKEGITSIDVSAFSNCTNLSSITIPKNVTSIDIQAFEQCSSLGGFWVDEANPQYSSDQYGVLFSKDKTKLLKAPQTLTGSYTVPDGVTTLGALTDSDSSNPAFNDCTKLTSVTLPDSVNVIDIAAFAGCSSLTKVNIPNGVKKIDYITFMNCTSLTSITIPDSVTDISNYVFSGCNNLTQITLGKGIQTIYANAFWGCDKLWHVLYTGTENEWNNINSDPQGYGDYEGNESLLSATRHYNCTGNEILDLTNKKCSICLANCNHNWDSGKVTKVFKKCYSLTPKECRKGRNRS
ncbi:MAG: leucine-rich repeat protein [Oscillospiraceae bacterium]|nr:leucine-rich repeat protein [Oscillospiraceae bacterium]